MSPRRLIVLLMLFALTPLFRAESAAAHPSGTYTINRYARIELYAREVRLVYVVDYSELPSLQWSISADIDGNGLISDLEVSAYVGRAKIDLLDQLSLTFNEQELLLVPISDAATFTVTDLGVETLRMEITYEAKATGENGTLEFRDENFSGIQGWRTVTVKPSLGTISSASRGLLADASGALTKFPEEWKDFPPKIRSLSFDWDASTGEALFAAAALPTAPQRGEIGSGKLGQLLRGELSFATIVLAMALAFLVGFVDSLGPGHGKTVVGSFMVGREGSASEALKIGVLAAVTHAITAISFGLFTLAASALFLPRAYAGIGLFAGISTIAFGILLISVRLTGWRAGHVFCSCVAVGSPARGSFVVGIASGLVPCPTAIILLLSAFALGRFSYGALLVAAFSLGTATALVCVAVGSMMIQRTAHRVGRLSAHAIRVANALPLLSAFIMVLAGVLITRQAVTGHML